MVKSNTAALKEPELVTDALEPAAPVVVVPTAIVATVPATPWGMAKLNTAALDVPELVTDALVPAAPVVVVPTAIVAAVPFVPTAP